MTAVRMARDETIPVSFTVNGSDVTVAVPARVTLADALRDHVGLTGTHLGCEHGVCGMCTVLVDGEAARSCLLFAVQCEGAEIVTIEGMGSPDDQHPLQRSFAHHHALQCGFCTPGFVVSSYDLLANGEAGTAIDAEDLPVELSGVLCRCTGYRNIVAAVADVAQAYPDGVPGPRACGQRTLVGRRGAVAGAPGNSGAEEASAPDAASAGLAMPAGEPTTTVDVTSDLGSPVESVWQVLDDIERLAGCLPGAELTEVLGDDRYRGRAKVSLGPVRLAFHGVAQVVERDAGARRLRVLARGEDTGGSATQAVITLAAEPAGTGTRLRAEADVYLSGRVAQFGRSLAGDVSRRLFEDFCAAVDSSAATGEAPPPRRAGALRLAVSAALAGLRRRLRAALTAARSPR
ncbi:MAG: 2Fe-2S iron-sulfur cluster binding domain-containing protein [Streptosporangiales bacterium]|nr:2Fe-2S iron-sulfur cluster binding domain-containing protein [Streptosporangiales bacterium]